MSQRLLLKDWLIRKLESQAYRNVCWVDRAQKTFAISWMHQSHHGFDDIDATVFKDWSLDSGYFKQSETAAHWKTRFRCAMSKSPYILEIKDAKFTSPDNKPYKLFQIIDVPRKKTMPSVPPHQFISAPFQNMNAADPQWQTFLTGPMIPAGLDDEAAFIWQNEGMGDSDSQLDRLLGDILFPEAQLLPEMKNECFEYLDFPIVSPMTEEVVDEEFCPGSPLIGTEQRENNIGNTLVPFEMKTENAQPRKHKSTTYHSFESQLDMNQKRPRTDPDDSGQIEIYYFGSLATTYRFINECHFRDRSDPQSTEGEQLPRYDAFIPPDPSGKLRKRVEMILDPQNIKGGLCLEYDSGSIYATRSCLVNIFYSNFADPKQSRKLSRNERTLIFDYEAFTRAVNEWRDSRNCKQPSDNVYLGFARRWFLDDENAGEMSAIVKSRRVQSELAEMTSLEEQIESLKISEQPGASAAAGHGQ